VRNGGHHVANYTFLVFSSHGFGFFYLSVTRVVSGLDISLALVVAINLYLFYARASQIMYSILITI